MAKQKSYSTKNFKSSEEKKKEQMTISFSKEGIKGDRSAIADIDYSAAYRGVGVHGGTPKQQNKKNRKKDKLTCKNACRGIYD